MPGARRWGGGERGRAVPGDHQHRLPSAVQRPEAAAPLTPPFSARLLPPGECPGPGGGSSPPAPGPAWHRHLRRRSGGCCSVKGPSALPLRPGPACRGALGSPHASRCYCNAVIPAGAPSKLFESGPALPKAGPGRGGRLAAVKTARMSLHSWRNSFPQQKAVSKSASSVNCS
ncbi:collagen alpha-1(I) chain-like isoform X4 [Malaclemys terrapin pileata]|uniref:collagen alpha-1(I) chain-like isoform X4 n=1 Tax=Malaclemys terrapin pileata TaxID=2991368 RepID=UPI0023A7F7B5|nr:collagen alpha-1(I) chain-like isoform X4 [Malaclemys terrapin pileata]